MNSDYLDMDTTSEAQEITQETAYKRFEKVFKALDNPWISWSVSLTLFALFSALCALAVRTSPVFKDVIYTGWFSTSYLLIFYFKRLVYGVLYPFTPIEWQHQQVTKSPTFPLVIFVALVIVFTCVCYAYSNLFVEWFAKVLFGLSVLLGLGITALTFFTIWIVCECGYNYEYPEKASKMLRLDMLTMVVILAIASYVVIAYPNIR